MKQINGGAAWRMKPEINSSARKPLIAVTRTADVSDGRAHNYIYSCGVVMSRIGGFES